MDETKYQKWGAIAGIEFVVLVLIGAFIGGTPPKLTDSAEKITKYYSDNQDALKVGNILAGLSLIAFLWFLGTLFQRLRAAEGGTGRVAGIALTGGVVVTAIAAVGYAINAFGVVYPGQGDGSFRISTIVFGYLGFPAAALVLGTSIVVMRTKVLPAWVAWLGGINAILWIVGGVVVASTEDAWGYIGFAAFLSLALWIVVVSVLLYQKSDA